MAVGGCQTASVDFFESVDDLDGLVGEGRLALETVQDDSLEQVAKREFTILGQSLEDFQQ